MIFDAAEASEGQNFQNTYQNRGHFGTIMGALTRNNDKSSADGARNSKNIDLEGLLGGILGGNGKNQNGGGFNIRSILGPLGGDSDGNGGGLDVEGILNTLGIDRDNLNISGILKKFGMNTGKINVGGVIEA